MQPASAMSVDSPEQAIQSTPTSSVTSLSEEDMRQVLYAALLRYAPETISLRERVLDRLVLGALIGSSDDNPLRVGAIRKNLRFGPDAPEIREEVVKETLDRLVQGGKVKQEKQRKVNVYSLVAGANDDLQRAQQTAVSLFNPVLKKLLENTEHLVSFEIGEVICRTYISECFARFGRQIAKTVTNEWQPGDSIKQADLSAAFSAAVSAHSISDEAKQSLEQRCINFFKSADSDDERLKFYLTQGYYFTQLLDLENRKFNPLGGHAFSGSVFYLDTNILIIGILACELEGQLFDEMVNVARRINIELRVTRATIDEVRRVAANRRETLDKILDVLPEELAKRTNDQFVTAFLESRGANPSLTPAGFLEPFDRLTNTLTTRWGITIVDKNEEEIIAGRDSSVVGRTMNESAEKFRGWGKTTATLLHDVCYFFLVCDERSTKPKTWFLTRDRTLGHAGKSLQSNGMSFCFLLDGFLQSISPYVTATEEHSLADLFSRLLKEQIFPADHVFDAQELALLAEMHADVMSTPTEQLLPAIDYVRSTVLHGKKYEKTDTPTVALALRKFLTASNDERRRELERQAQLERQTAEQERQIAIDERSKRIRAETEMHRAEDERDELQAQVIAARSSESQSIWRESRARSRRLFLQMLLGFAVGAFFWNFDQQLSALVLNKWPRLLPLGNSFTLGLDVVGALIFAFPALRYFNASSLKAGVKFAAGVLVIALALISCVTVLFDSVKFANWASCVTVATVIAMFFLREREP